MFNTVKNLRVFRKLAPHNITGATERFCGRIRNFRAAKDGVAAVEFVFIAPIMIALYLGLVEISLIIQADKAVSHATNVAGDLATQVPSMDVDDIEDVLEATLATMVIKEDKIPNVSVEILSFRILPDGTREEIGRATLGSAIVPAYDPNDIGTRLLTVNSGAVVARVVYDYESVSYRFVDDFTKLDETFILKPRASSDIPFGPNGTPGGFTCTAASSVNVNCTPS